MENMTTPSSLDLTMAIPKGCNMRELDMNQPACGIEEEYFSMGVVEDEEEDYDGCCKAKPKKLRLSKDQSMLLEQSFLQTQNLNHKQKEALTVKLKLRPRQVEVWFQNRRARMKLKQTEMECEYLKRCFGSLTEENKRLQREVEELSSLRLAPPTAIVPHMHQPMLALSLTMSFALRSPLVDELLGEEWNKIDS